MDNVNLLNMIINMIKSNDISTVFYIVMIISFVFMFNMFKKSKTESEKYDNERINNSIRLCSILLLKIYMYEKQDLSFEKLCENIYALYEYLPYEVTAKIDKWICDDDRKTEDLRNLIKTEIKNLKLLQYDPAVLRLNDYLDIFSYYYYKDKFNLILEPAVSSFICIFVFMIIIALLYKYNNYNLILKTFFIVEIISLSMYVFLVLALIDLFSKRKFKCTFLNIILSIVLAFSLILLIGSNNFIIKTLCICYLLFYFIFVLKKCIKRNKLKCDKSKKSNALNI